MSLHQTHAFGDLSASHHQHDRHEPRNQNFGINAAMEVPTEILVLLSNTQSLDQALRTTAEERLKFFEQNELGKLYLYLQHVHSRV